MSAFNQSMIFEGEFKNGRKAVMWKYLKPVKKDCSALTRNYTLYGEYALFLEYNFKVLADFFLDNIVNISYLREIMPILTSLLLAHVQGESRTHLETIDAGSKSNQYKIVPILPLAKFVIKLEHCVIYV